MTTRNKAAIWKAAQRAVQSVTKCERCGAVSKVLQRHHAERLATNRAYRERHREEINAKARERYRVKQEASRDM